MCKQAGRIKAFPHALAKMYGRHFQTLVYVLRLKKKKRNNGRDWARKVLGQYLLIY